MYLFENLNVRKLLMSSTKRTKGRKGAKIKRIVDLVLCVFNIQHLLLPIITVISEKKKYEKGVLFLAVLSLPSDLN